MQENTRAQSKKTRGALARRVFKYQNVKLPMYSLIYSKSLKFLIESLRPGTFERVMSLEMRSA